MNVKQLRTRLNALLGDLLGTYTNGIPSIWVYGSGSLPPASSNGLEVLIKESANNSVENASCGAKYHPREWEITFKNFSRTSKLLKAMRRVELNFTTRKRTHYPATEEILERGKICIFDPTPASLTDEE